MLLKNSISRFSALLVLLSFANVASAGLATDNDDMFDFLAASNGYIQAGTDGQYEGIGGSKVFDAGDIISAVSHFTVKTASDGGSPQSSITPENGTQAALVWLAQLTDSTDNAASSSLADGTATVSAVTNGFGTRLSNLSTDSDFNASAFAFLLVSPSVSNGGVDLNSLTSIAAINTAAASGSINIAASYDLSSASETISYTFSSSSSTNSLSFELDLTGSVDSDFASDGRFTLGTSATLRTGSFNTTAGIDGYDATASTAANYNLLSGSKTHFTMDVSVLPEPSSLIVLAGMAFGAVGVRRRRRNG